MKITKAKLRYMMKCTLNETIYKEEQVIENALNSLDIDEKSYNFNAKPEEDYND